MVERALSIQRKYHGMNRNADDKAVQAAFITGMALISAHVAMKATNDSLFLSFFAVSSLPVMLMISSLIAMAAVHRASRLLVRLGPGKVVPGAFVISAILLSLAWLIMKWSPRAAAVLLFLHVSAVGSILISGFWSMINERFDPHTAKKKIGTIGLGGGIGGVLGGLVAGGVAAGFGQAPMLLVLAAAHLFCGWTLRGLRAPHNPASTSKSSSAPESAIRVLARNRFIRHIGLLVLFVSVTCVLLEYVFKAYAVQSFEKGAPLMQFFSAYYLAVGIISLIIQFTLSRPALDNLGLTGTVAILPCATAAGAAGALIAPGLAAAIPPTLSDTVLQNSLFRSAYELLYVPIAPAEKRAAKTVVDVGIRRLADTLGGGLAKLILFIAPAIAIPIMLVVAALLSVAEFILTFVLRRDYVATLKQSLAVRADELDMDEFADSLSRTIILQAAGERSKRARHRDDAVPPIDPAARDTAILKSGDPAQVLALLARDDIWQEALTSLTVIAQTNPDPLAGALLDPDAEFTIRRRLPLAFRRCSNPAAIKALLAALNDSRFEVRFNTARVLARTHHRQQEVPGNATRILTVIDSEASVSSHLWQGRSLLDRVDDFCPSLFVDDTLKTITHPAVEHIFNLLSLIGDFAPLRIAFRGLHTADPALRGTALEFLGACVPLAIANKLLAKLEADPSSITIPDKQKAEEKLMLSSASIEINLSQIGKLK